MDKQPDFLDGFLNILRYYVSQQRSEGQVNIKIFNEKVKLSFSYYFVR